MSQTIDDRVVQLEFENSGFEQGVQESLTTLQKLKQSLNFDSAAKNLTAISNAASRFDLSGIGNAVEQVGEKFSYMKYAGLVALSNLVTGAMHAGSRIANALIGPITSGGWNRAMNLEQANFMMEGVLKDAGKVQDVMKAVNQSVDGTAYSLDAAAKVASQFAATGIESYEEMLKPLQAIAGVAGMTNASFEEIGDIFTTIRSRGKMTREEINRLAVRGLAALPALSKEMGKTEEEVSSLISKGQVSFETFVNAMHNAFSEQAQKANDTFTGAMSNVRSALGRIGAEFATPFIRNMIPVLNSFRLAINATKATLTPFFTTSADIMAKLSKIISTTLNNYTDFVKKHTGTIAGIYKDLISVVKNLFNFTSKIIQPIRDAFHETFESKTLAYIKKISTAIVLFTNKLTLTDEKANQLKTIFRGFFSIFSTLGILVRRAAMQLSYFSPVVSRVGNYVLSFLEKISNHLLNFNKKVDGSDFLKGNIFENLKDKISESIKGLEDVGIKFTTAFDNIKKKISEGFTKGIKDINSFEKNVSTVKTFFLNVFEAIKEVIIKLGDIIKKLFTDTSSILSTIPQLVEAMFSGLARAISGFINSQTVKDLLSLTQSGLFIAIAENIRKATKKMDLTGDLFSFFKNFKIAPALVDMSWMNTLTANLKELGNKAVDIAKIQAIGGAILELAFALLIVSTIDTDKLLKSVAALGSVIGAFATLTTIFNKQGLLGVVESGAVAAITDAFKNFATALIILSGAMLILSTISPERLATATLALVVIFAVLERSVGILRNIFTEMMRLTKMYGQFGKYTVKTFKAFSNSIKSFAVSILILAVSMKLLSTIPFSNLIDSLIAFTTIMVEMTLALKVISKLDMSKEAGKAILKVGVMLLVLAGALKLLSTIPIEQMNVALKGLFGGLMSMAAALALLGAISVISKKVIGRGLRWDAFAKSLASLAVGILLLAGALKIISTIPVESMTATLDLLIGSLAAMVGSLAVLGLVSNKLNGFKFGSVAANLVAVAGAIVILSAGLKIISTISLTKVSGTLALLGGTMLTIVASLTALAIVSKSLDGFKFGAIAANLLVVSGAIAILSVALSIMGKVNEKMASFGLLAGSLIAICVALSALSGIDAIGMIAAAAAITAVSGAMFIMASALALISNFSFDQLIGAVVALTGGLAVLAILLAGMGTAWAPILAGAGVLLGIFAALALGVLAFVGVAYLAGKAFEVIGIGIASIGSGMLLLSSGLESLSKTLPALVGILTTVAGLAFLAPRLIIMSAALLAVGSTLTIVGIASNILGAGFIVLSKGLQLISDYIVKFAAALKVTGTILKNSKSEVNAFILTMLKLSLLAIIAPLIIIIGASLVVLGAGLKLVGAGMILVSNGINILIGALSNLGQFIATVAAVIFQILTVVWEVIIAGITNVVNFIRNIDWAAVWEFIKEKITQFIDWFKSIDWKLVFIKITLGIAAILSKIGELLKKAWTWFKEKLAEWGEDLKAKLSEAWENLKSKISEKWEELKSLIIAKWEEFKSRIGQWKSSLVERGKFIIQGLIEGIEEGLKDLAGIPKKIYDKIVGGIEEKFDIDSPSKVTYWDGLMVMMGFNNGMEEGAAETGNVIDEITGLVDGGLTGLVDKAKDKVKSFFNLDISKANKEIEGSISDVTKKLSEGNLTMGEWTNTAGKSWDRVKELTNELNRLQGEYDAGRMSLEEYKAATGPLEAEIYKLIGSFEDLQSALAAIDDELRLAQNENSKYMDMVRQGTMQQSVYFEITKKNTKAIHDLNEMKYNLTGTTKNNTEATEKETAATNANTSSKSRNAKANKDLAESLESTLTNQLNLFSKFEAKNPMNKDELLNNMRSQIKGMTDWAGQMNKLAQMGIDQGLYKKLAEMGPQGAEYVGAFVNMSAEELAQANEMWAQSLVLPGDISKQIGADFNNIGLNVGAGLANGITGSADTIKNATNTTVQENTTDEAMTVLQEQSPSRVFHEIGMNVDLGLALGIQDFRNVVYTVLETMCKNMIVIAKRELNPENFKPIGAGVVEGVNQGIEENMSILETAMQKLASMVEQAARSPKGFDVNSPSKRMIPIGEGVGEGLALGINRSSAGVTNSISSMADNAVSQMKQTIANIASMINNEMEDPVITPVLDLSKVQAGARLLNSTFSANAAIAAGASQLSALQNGQYPGGNVVFNQYNNSPKALSRIDIYRDTRNMLSQFKQATT